MPQRCAARKGVAHDSRTPLRPTQRPQRPAAPARRRLQRPLRGGYSLGARAFTVSGLAALDQIQQVVDAAAQATASGQTLREWRKTLAPEVLSLGKARTELILRNAVQTNYGIGRTIQQRQNAAARPYLMWDAINDGRTRPTHRAMDGHVAPIDAPIWKRWNPPAGHNCRCTRISLTQEQAQRRGLGTPAPDAQPDAGWEGDPSEGNEDLLRIVRARQASCLTTFAATKAKARLDARYLR